MSPTRVALFVRMALAIAVALLLGGCGATTLDRPHTPTGWPPAVPSDAFRAQVVRVVDGDTFIARVNGVGAQLRVRVIGIDTPETVKPGTPVRCFGPQASAYAKELLTHQWVRAAHEPGGDTDRYGRQLWDVWLSDGRFLAGELAAGGFARAYPYSPQIFYASRLKAVADAAEAAGRGLWGASCHGDSFGS